MRKRIPTTMRKKIWGMYKGRCAYCGKPIRYKDMQVDHVKPLHLGGKDEEINYKPACRMCNFYKHTMTVRDFREQLEKLTTRMQEKFFIYRLAMRYGLINETNEPVVFYFEKETPQEPQNEAVGGDSK